MSIQLLRGNEDPEGFIIAPRGTFYYNTATSALFIKLRGGVDADTNVGWKGINSKGIYSGNGNPEGVVYAPCYAYYLDMEDSTNPLLYFQLNQESELSTTGWVGVLGHELHTATGYPSNPSLPTGDTYIDIETLNFYIKTDTSWVLISTITTSSLDVISNLSKALTNEIALANVAFDLFISAVPQDVTVTQYNKDGKLESYTIPNRAKGFIAQTGEGAPEGIVEAPIGTMYIDRVNREFYTKLSDMQAAYGWVKLLGSNSLSQLLEYNPITREYTFRLDSRPTEGSSKFLTSGAIYSCLTDFADKEGDMYQTFAVGNPIESCDATNKAYVDGIVSTINGLSGDVSGFVTTLQTLTGRVNANEENISNLQARVSALEMALQNRQIYITEMWAQGPDYYIVYNNRWCEQGGRFVSAAGGDQVHSLWKTYAYFCSIIGNCDDTQDAYPVSCNTRIRDNSSFFYTTSLGGQSWSQSVSWKACGWLPEGV